jgi:RNA methyltransferase, TrmH family
MGRPMKAITSEANPTFRAWLRLATQARAVRRQRQALAEGLHLAQAALEQQVPVEAVLLRRGTRAAEAERLACMAAAGGAAAYELAATLFDRIAPVQHGAGLMLIVAVPEHAAPVAATHDLLYLDGLQDPGNVGTLLRTAAAAGITEVMASPATAALWSAKTLRAGQGAHFRLRLHEQVAASALPAMLDGPWIGADAHGAVSLWSTELPAGSLGWIFGTEGTGLSAAARAICRKRVSIPIDAAAESLNVAAAAAICLFERRRRLLPSL